MQIKFCLVQDWYYNNNFFKDVPRTVAVRAMSELYAKVVNHTKHHPLYTDVSVVAVNVEETTFFTNGHTLCGIGEFQIQYCIIESKHPVEVQDDLRAVLPHFMKEIELEFGLPKCT